MPINWTWALTGYQFPDKTHEQIVKICRFSGAASLEANSRFVEGQTEKHIEDVRTKYRDSGVGLETFHLPMGAQDDICEFYETRRSAAVEHLKRLFEGAAQLGARTLILHPTTNRLNVEDEGLDRYLHFMNKSLQVLIPHAEKLDLSIALENMLPGEGGFRLGSSPGHFKIFEREFAHPNLGYCLDTGHAQISGEGAGPGQFIEIMGERVIAVHLQDNAGDRDSHLAPGRGLVKWDTVFQGMARIGFNQAACIEAPPFSYGPNKSYSPEGWKSLISETTKMAEDCLEQPK